MRPTLSGQGQIEIDAGAYEDAAPQIGDIVALQGPSGLEYGQCAVNHPRSSPCPASSGSYNTIRLVKRVVAGPGDRVAFTPEGRLILNGRQADEPYINECPRTCGLPTAIVVPADHFFVAGDNRPRSSDSRIWGPVPAAAIDGRVTVGSD